MDLEEQNLRRYLLEAPSIEIWNLQEGRMSKNVDALYPKAICWLSCLYDTNDEQAWKSSWKCVAWVRHGNGMVAPKRHLRTMLDANGLQIYMFLCLENLHMPCNITSAVCVDYPALVGTLFESMSAAYMRCHWKTCAIHIHSQRKQLID